MTDSDDGLRLWKAHPPLQAGRGKGLRSQGREALKLQVADLQTRLMRLNDDLGQIALILRGAINPGDCGIVRRSSGRR